MLENMVLMMPKTESISLTGINEGNIETFKNTPMLSLTKEELQNSSDGRDKSNDAPVFVEFNDFYLNTSDIPDLATLKSTFLQEKEFWDAFTEKDKKAVEFFDNAIEILSKDKIRCLRISDSNTTGLLGIDEEFSSPWNNLVVNTNVSDKAGDDGGSFGIGKNAAFASTHLRLVFYNTINQDNEKAFQGVIKLPSYKHNGENFVGTAFYSLKDTKQKPIRESLSLDPTYTRTDVGMDKYIVGFGEDLDDESLKDEIIISAIQNFLYSFYTGKLIVKYKDVFVDQEHLDAIIKKYSDKIDDVTLEMYETLIDPDKTFEISVIDDNDVKMYIKLDPNYSRRANIVRGNGMKVFDMGNISGRIGFSAVVFLEGKNVNAYFKKLENPEHNKWAMDRAKNKWEAIENRKKITDPLKNYITEMHRQNLGDEIDSDGMGEYLPYTYTHGKNNKVEGLSNQVKEEKKKAKPKVKQPTSEVKEEITYQEDELGNIIENTIDIKTQGTHHGGGGDSEFPSDENNIDEDGEQEIHVTQSTSGDFTIKKTVPEKNISVKYSRDNDAYNLIVNSEVVIKKGFIEVLISTETSTMPVVVSNATVNGVAVKTLGGKIYLENIEANSSNAISFDLSNKDDWALEVNVYES